MLLVGVRADVPVVAVTLAVTRLFDLPLQQSWQESELPQSSLTQQREIRPPLLGGAAKRCSVPPP